MRRVSNSGERRYEVWFALGNVVPALVLSAGLFALPVRWWPTDVVIATAIVALLATSALALVRPPLARRALRVGARVLLAVGLVLIAAATLSLAFLAGIHGDFGRGGVTLMVLVLFLVLPYVVLYPIVELLWLGPSPARPKASAAKAPSAAPAPPAAPPAAPESPESASAAGDGGASA